MKPTIPRFMEICELVMGDEESPNLDGVTKEELLHFGRVVNSGVAIKQKELCFWRKLCYILGGTLVLSCLIDLLKLAEVI